MNTNRRRPEREKKNSRENGGREEKRKRSSDKKSYADSRKPSDRVREDGAKPWKGKKPSYKKSTKKEVSVPTTLRLNRFIANAGICSRREADNLIKEGRVEINGKVVTDMGIQVKPSDTVKFDGKNIISEKPVYILLNKPKDYITTKSDPQGRKTVMELVRQAGRERIFPVGRLDKNTTGLLLLTNDGDLTKKLTHPSHQIKKIYHVVLDKVVDDEHILQWRKGFDLEDGFIKADKVSIVEGSAGNEVGIELHSGRNRIVRRMMEHLGYKVLRLDRVMFANLTKKDLPRGKWRRLTPKEVGLLQTIANR